ncbi:MAG: mitochondrial import inner membrane translocase subunit TIM16, partial [Marteilia pararefringens]
ESLKILNVERLTDRQNIENNFAKYFNQNSPENGGNIYLQSKIFRAKECIDQHKYE